MSLLKVLAKYDRKISNDYMLANQYNALIKHEKLSYHADGDALYIFEEREGFKKLYFRLLNSEAKICHTEGFVVANTVCRGEYTDGVQDEWLIKNGFLLSCERVCYSTDSLQIDAKSEPIDIVGAQEAYPIYMECFTAVSADLPCKDIFEGAFCIRDGETPIGVLSMGNDRQLAVLPQYRGRGIATRLYKMLADYYKTYRLRIWTDKDNAASNALYQKIGFKRENMSAKCYVKNGG